jgi:hypothetical protein
MKENILLGALRTHVAHIQHGKTAIEKKNKGNAEL